MKTVETFVVRSIKINPEILFIAENCPNLDMYVYRKLIKKNYKGANNLLNNLCNVTKISGDDEKGRLDKFIEKYAVIDTYKNGEKWKKSTKSKPGTPRYSAKEICADIVYLNPKQIIFTCIRSNGGKFFEEILSELKKVKLDTRIVYRIDKKTVFNSPSDRAFSGFSKQINDVVAAGNLTL